MKIGFDGKRAVSNRTGLGNYSRFVISNLVKYYSKNTYKIFSEKKPSKEIKEAINLLDSDYIFKQTKMPFWRTLGINKAIEKEDLDIYHGLSNELPFRIDHTGIKSIVTIHDLIFLKYPQFYPVIDRIIYNIKAKYACKVSDRIVAVSECTKRDIMGYYGIPSEKIDVVYQGCFSIFKESADETKKREVKEKYNLPSKYLLSVGSIEERKNILLIVKALKHIPNIHFVSVGKQQKYAEEVKKYALENGLSDRVHLLSNIPLFDLPTIIQCCKVFIYPSLYEGFGIPIIEALNSKVPVIGAKGSCLEEAGGPNSIYVNPHEELELAKQVNRLLSDHSLCDKMISEGLEYVKRFSDKSCTDALYEVYKSVK